MTEGMVYWIPVGARRQGGAGILTLLSLATDSDQGHVIGGLADGEIRGWDLSTESVVRRTGAHNGPVWALSLVEQSPGEPILVSGGADGVIRLWDLGSLELLGELNAPRPGQVRALHATSLAGQSVLASA